MLHLERTWLKRIRVVTSDGRLIRIRLRTTSIRRLLSLIRRRRNGVARLHRVRVLRCVALLLRMHRLPLHRLEGLRRSLDVLRRVRVTRRLRLVWLADRLLRMERRLCLHRVLRSY